jgi:hypothetical protein
MGGDLALPVVQGRRPLPVRVANRYLDKLLTAAERDPVLAERFLRVGHFLDAPSALLRPAVVRRVLVGNRRRHTPGPAVMAEPAQATAGEAIP